MQQTLPREGNSWSCSQSPMVMSSIFAATTGVTVWHRPPQQIIETYFETCFRQLGLGLRTVHALPTLRENLAHALPDCPGKSDVIDDIYLLADMLTCLFDCDSVGLRLAPLTSAMCPRFHIDNIPVRLVTTYLGAGTEWLPMEYVAHEPPQDTDLVYSKMHAGYYFSEAHVRQMKAFEVGLLKGKAWPLHEDVAAIHRSCAVKNDEKRVLLTLDPL